MLHKCEIVFVAHKEIMWDNVRRD